MNRKPWRKVLYEMQGYADNYTDKHTFLRDLRKNVDFSEVSLGEAILGATLLVQEFCTVMFFVLMYVNLLNERIHPETALGVSSLTTFIGFCIYRVVFSDGIRQNLTCDLRTVLIFLVFGYLFSPVLHTLTDTISTDSIYTTTSLAMLVHLIFFDYGVNVVIVSRSLSFNASIFGGICLASRLASTLNAFILLTLAVEYFVLFPLLRRQIRYYLTVTGLLLIINVCLLMLISKIFTLIFLLVLAFINILCPVLYVRSRKYKENIYGPWDEAVIDPID